MKDNCPTTQHIQACAKAALELGEPTCLTKIGGVVVTVHAPFEGPLPRAEAEAGLVAGRPDVQHGKLERAEKPFAMPVIVTGWVDGDGQPIATPFCHSLN